MQSGFPIRGPAYLPAALERREEGEERGYMPWAVARWPYPCPASWGDHRGLLRFDWAESIHSSLMSSKGGQCLGPQSISSFHIPGIVVGLQRDIWSDSSQ